MIKSHINTKIRWKLIQKIHFSYFLLRFQCAKYMLYESCIFELPSLLQINNFCFLWCCETGSQLRSQRPSSRLDKRKIIQSKLNRFNDYLPTNVSLSIPFIYEVQFMNKTHQQIPWSTIDCILFNIVLTWIVSPYLNEEIICKFLTFYM